MPRSYSVGYLRAFVTVLVVLHHVVLGYHPFAPAPGPSLTAEPRLWPIFPVSDPARTMAAGVLSGFFDIFFMSLMFLLSGVFVWHSLSRKGVGAFLRGRGVRLGVPFLMAPLLLAPLAYVPSYLQTTAPTHTAADFVHQWLSLDFLPAGPAWFLWVLLCFDVVAAALFVIAPRTGALLGRLAGAAGARPLRFFAVLVLLSALGYVPMALAFTPMHWITIGPFAVQTSRVLHYFAYFVAGIGVGMAGLDFGLLDGAGRLARRWWIWLAAATVIYVIAAAAFLMSLSPEAPTLPWDVINAFGFVASCAATSMALVGVFVRFARPSRIFDGLSRNAYGIYVVHYIVVSWVQYALLPAAWPGLVKVAVAFGGSLAISWGLAVLLRRIPAVARVI